MPKSSTDRRTPMSLRLRIFAIVASRLSASRLSVSSSFSRSGRMPARLAQVGGKRRVRGGHGLHLGIEEAHVVAARGLGLVHRQVRLLEQLVHARRGLAEQRDADAAGAEVQV